MTNKRDKTAKQETKRRKQIREFKKKNRGKY